MIVTILATLPMRRLRVYPDAKFIPPNNIQIVGGDGNNAIIKDAGSRKRNQYLVAESIEQINFLKNYPKIIGYNPLQDGVSAAGTTQGTATALTKLISIVTTSSGSANGVSLPKAHDNTIEFVYLVVNKSTSAISVYPASGDFINNLAVDVSISIPVGQIGTFYVKYNPNAEAE